MNMRKGLFFLLVLTVVFSSAVFAQPQAYDSRIEYQKTQQQVAVIELPYKQDVVEDAVKDYMLKKGLKSSSSKGFDVYRSTKLDDADNDLSDLYFKIDKKKKDKDYTVISLLPVKANADILTRPVTDSTGQMDKAKAFLNNIVPYVDAHNTDVEIDKQQDVMKKVQKKLNGYIGDSTDLEKKIRNLHSDEDQNKSDILKQTTAIQSAINENDDVKTKAQKRMNKLLDEQDNIRKKLRNAQTDLDQAKNNIAGQQRELASQQQVLDAIKAKKKS
jgi:chromosome segregation ATPase